MAGPREGLARLERAAESGEIDALCIRHGVRLLTVFGSTARGETAPRDLDVGVLFEHDARPDVVELMADLTELARVDVDLSRTAPDRIDGHDGGHERSGQHPPGPPRVISRREVDH